MAQEDINNGNRLIVDLMGKTIKIEQEGVKDIPLAFLSIEDMKFHQSWKWLMPVVIKIEEEVGYTVRIEENTCKVIVDEGTQFAEEADTKLEAVWEAIVKFLNWKKEQ